jgi:hypothetical protein
MVHEVDFASWVSLRSLPPKEEIVAVVLKDILRVDLRGLMELTKVRSMNMEL